MSEEITDSIDGWYDDNGNPCIAFHLCGVVHTKPGIECNGIVDTGFSGFIQMPFDKACELRLPLEGTAGVMLANGSTQIVLTALGIATLANVENVGTVHLSPSSEILVGMEFLRKFEHGLGVFRDSVFLLPDKISVPRTIKDD